MDRLLSRAASSGTQPGMLLASPGSSCELCHAPPAADKGASNSTAGTVNFSTLLPPLPTPSPHSSWQHALSPHRQSSAPEDSNPFDPASRCASWDDGCMFDEDNFAAAAMPPLSDSFNSRLPSGSWGPLTHSSWGGGGGGGSAVSASRDDSLDDPLQSWLLHAEWQAPRDRGRSSSGRLSGGSGGSDQSPLRAAFARPDSDGPLQPACLQSDDRRDAAAFAGHGEGCISAPSREPVCISPFAAAGSPRRLRPAGKGPSSDSQHATQLRRPAESKIMGHVLPAHSSGATINTAAAECGSMPRLSSDLEPSGSAAAVPEGATSSSERWQELSMLLLQGKETGACKGAGIAEQSMTPLLAFRDRSMEHHFASWQTAHRLQVRASVQPCKLPTHSVADFWRLQDLCKKNRIALRARGSDVNRRHA